MSAAQATVVETVRGSSPETKMAVLAMLIREIGGFGRTTTAAEDNENPLLSALPFRPVHAEPPVLSAEEEAELARRSATPEDSVPIEDVIAELRAMARGETR